VRPQRIEVHVDELVLHGFGQVDAVGLGETITDHLQESLRRDPDGLRTADVEVVATERHAAANLSGPALADLISASLDGALRP
jgi:hypothetical protein